MAQIRLSEEIQKQLKDNTIDNKVIKLLQDFGNKQSINKKLPKKNSDKTVMNNFGNKNWLKYGEDILGIARDSVKKAYKYTASLRSKKYIGRLEILDGLNGSIKTKRILAPTNIMLLRDQINDEHRVMLNKIYKNSYAATDNIAKLLRTGQVGQFITEGEVDNIISEFIILSLIELDVKNIDAFFASIVAYGVRTTDCCIRIAKNIEECRENAIKRLCARNNYSAAKDLAIIEYASNLIHLSKSNKTLERIIKNEKEYKLREERIRTENMQIERNRAAREEVEKKMQDERRRQVFRIEKSKIFHQKYNNLLRLLYITSIDNLESILANGIYSRERAERELYFTDIAAEGALMNHRYANIYGEELDHYARCFFNPLPPMYHMRLKDGEKLCIIELWIPFERVSKYNRHFHNLKIISNVDCLSYYPRYYKQSIASNKQNLKSIEAHDLNSITWDSSYEAFVNNPDLCKAKRGAEVLIHELIPNVYIAKVYTDENIEIPHKKIAELKKYYDLGKPSIVRGEI